MSVYARVHSNAAAASQNYPPQDFYPSNQPIVQVSIAQTAMKIIVKTQITGTRVNLHSGGNTTLAGAVVKANTVNADIKGNLTITSLQDTSSFNETSRSSGGSISSSRAAINSN
jgi:uncharacterized membrane protein YgcG